MRVAALISGGKDSCFNMMSCIAEGHDVVALANLRPENKDELDSYMYQTVGHHAIDLYAEAMGLPLYVRGIKGSSLCITSDYLPQEGDEVEDLYHLLSLIKVEKDIDAVSVGAILSDYQRVRVENVCQRLNLRVLAFLWRRNQEDLLREMIACDLKAIVIKVAALGLLPDTHLGMELKDIFPHMLKMKEKYGLNECGEGGEYETFVFDCPLFKKSIVIEQKELVIHSDDAFAPVGYLNLKKCHLQEKTGYDAESFLKNVNKLPLTTTCKWIAKHICYDDGDDVSKCMLKEVADTNICPHVTSLDFPPILRTDGVNFQVSGLRATVKDTSDISCATKIAMDSLKACIDKLGHQMADLTSVSLYVQDMSDYAHINAVYVKYFEMNPPVRICIQVCLPPEVLFQIDCEGCKEDGDDRRTMHVQSLSHWAPANIGPFSQAVLARGKLFISGTVALIPSNLKLIDGGITIQSKVALIHVVEKLVAMKSLCTLAHCPLVNCYVTKKEHIAVARGAFNSLLQETRNDLKGSDHLSPAIQFCVVPKLPKGASIEWQVYAWVFSSSGNINKFQTFDAAYKKERVEKDVFRVSFRAVSVEMSEGFKMACIQSRDFRYSGRHFTKTYPFYTIIFDCTWFQELFSCRIEVCSAGTDRVDVKELLHILLKEYYCLMETRKEVCEQNLTKIFFSARKFSCRELIDSFTQDVPGVDMKTMPTFSFIPVISLESDRHLLVWCQ